MASDQMNGALGTLLAVAKRHREVSEEARIRKCVEIITADIAALVEAEREALLAIVDDERDNSSDGSTPYDNGGGWCGWMNACRRIEQRILALGPAPAYDAAIKAAEARGAAEMEARKDDAYLERNRLVALLASIYPAVRCRTAIDGWSEDWHGCVYITLPTGQASWHYHDSQAHLFRHVSEGRAEWDGHTTEEKYGRIAAAIRAAAGGGA